MSEAVSYSEVKALLLSSYWQGCAGGSFSGWTHRQVCAWAYSEFDGSYDYSSDHFMLELVCLVMVGDWYPDMADQYRNQMRELMCRPEFNDEVRRMPEGEREQLLADLEVVGIHLDSLRGAG